jgi:UDP-N-acetylmuramoyl-tripeptide--D-alanyl-D-alanine ligase
MMMRLFTLKQIADIFHSSSSMPALTINGYCVDSRLLEPGQLFFALKGARVDGHDYLFEARDKGAIGAVVSKDYTKQIPGLELISVEDPLQALQTLAQWVILHSSSRIVAITGSVGKTSTKEFIRTVLSEQYRVSASPGNHNSQIGVPLSILNHTTGEEEVIVLEMGMTAPGHLTRLIQIASPEVAVLTTVALVHACHFHSLHEIAWTKAEIFTHPRTQLGILHRDIPDFDAICRATPCLKHSFSTTSPDADYVLDPIDSRSVYARLEKHRLSLTHDMLPGKHNIHNLMAAVAVARYFKIDWPIILHSLPKFKLLDHRLHFVHHQGLLFLNDSYNASEISVKAALQILPKPKDHGRKIAVLGSMLELGRFSEECHSRVGEFALQYVDELYCLGEECEPLYKIWQAAGRPVYWFNHRSDLVASLRQNLRPTDVVLLKGSRSKELWKVLEEL